MHSDDWVWVGIMGATTDERVMRCEVTGGFVEVRYRHDMTVEDVGDLIAYLDVLRRHLAKRIGAEPTPLSAEPHAGEGAKEPPYDPRGSYTCAKCGQQPGMYGHPCASGAKGAG